ncbi:MAG: DoxX family membrane protein [bacterium]|nr:DoxX family membrane protein [bacterium]
MSFQKISLLFLRVSLGGLFLYAGITKVINPEWSAVGYLKGAKTFSGLYQWLASPELLSVTNLLNEWGLTLIGASLILGLGVRLSGILGALLMLMYYFPILEFPYVGEHSFLIDEHIVYAASLLVLSFSGAGRFWGLEGKIPFLSRFLK